jgi:hypothetical protein
MPRHEIGQYRDGTYTHIDFCKLCGVEGHNLNLECVGIAEDDSLERGIKNNWARLDKSKLFR